MPIIRQIIDKLICGKCGSGQVYTKQKGTILVCRLCGTEEENVISEHLKKEVTKGVIQLIDKDEVR